MPSILDAKVCICTGSTKTHRHDSDCFEIGERYFYTVIVKKSKRNNQEIHRTKYKVYADFSCEWPREFSPKQFEKSFKPV
jgi:hypothetical protein